jgi:hypothetical protein
MSISTEIIPIGLSWFRFRENSHNTTSENLVRQNTTEKTTLAEIALPLRFLLPKYHSVRCQGIHVSKTCIVVSVILE